MSRFVETMLTFERATEILDLWGDNAQSLDIGETENLLYWNNQTGELLGINDKQCYGHLQ